jgi:glycosyltransferase involved in cell wall biosynthesis
LAGGALDICVLNPFFYPFKGGTEKVLIEVYKRLAKRHNITVITSAPAERNRPITEHIFGIKVVRLRTFQEHIPIFPMPFLFFDGLKKTLVKECSDIYHINNRYQFFEDTVIAIKGMNKKLALTIHNSLPKNIDPLTDDLGRFYDWLWGRKLMHAADVITGVSTNTINTTVPKSERHKTHLVFNGVDHKKFRPINKGDRGVARVKRSLGFDGGEIVLSNGRLITQKGQKYLIQAVAGLVNRNHEDINLLIVGNGPLKNQLYRLAKKNGIADRFRIVYGLDDERLPYYYNASKAFSLPSLYEPAGLALLEALSCEVPCVISRVGGMPELVGDCAFYSKPKDYYSLKTRISYVLENEKTAHRVARRGRQRMVKYHDWDRIAKQYESLFLSTIRY